MPTDFHELPDVEAVARQWLSDGALAVIGTRWYSSVPSTPTYPLGTVKRIGGIPAIRQALDAGNIQVEVWGTSKSEARDIAAAARVRLLRLEGKSVTTPVAAFVSAVDDSLGLTWQPDPDTGRDRYLFSVLVYARASGGAGGDAGFGTGGFGE